MGDPRKQRRKYSRPTHPWQIERINEENELMRKYGLKNKKEIWRAHSRITNYRRIARELLGNPGEHAEKEGKKLLDKLNRLGLMDSHNLEDVLALTIEDLLERRLQTVVYRKGLSSTIRQARQMIVHGHIMVGGRKVTVPSFLVYKGREDLVELNPKLQKKVIKE